MTDKPNDEQVTTKTALEYIRQQTGRRVGRTNIKATLAKSGIHPVNIGNDAGRTCYYDLREIDAWCISKVEDRNVTPYEALKLLLLAECEMEMKELSRRVGYGCSETTLSLIKSGARPMTAKTYVKIGRVLEEVTG